MMNMMINLLVHQSASIQFNSFNTHCWVILHPNNEISPHHLLQPQPANDICTCEPNQLNGKFFAIHSICDWWWWLCMLLNLHIYSPHQIEYKFSSWDQLKMHHITSGVFVSCIVALPFYIKKVCILRKKRRIMETQIYFTMQKYT